MSMVKYECEITSIILRLLEIHVSKIAFYPQVNFFTVKIEAVSNKVVRSSDTERTLARCYEGLLS